MNIPANPPMTAPTDNDIPALDDLCDKFNTGAIDINSLVCGIWNVAYAAGRRERVANDALFDLVVQIRNACDHQIPYYAYGDNEAACRMSDTMQQISDDLIPLLEHFEANE